MSQFDLYLENSPKKRVESTPNVSNARVVFQDYGNDRLQQLFNERQKREQEKPVDSCEELTRYLADPIVDEKECGSLLEWWKASTVLLE